MNIEEQKSIKWSENVIIADADYIDNVAFNLIVNFERMIGRPIPQADIARWIECVALDGGLREGEHETQVVLIHHKKNAKMENFRPSDYEQELNGKAFHDHLGNSSSVVSHGGCGERRGFLHRCDADGLRPGRGETHHDHSRCRKGRHVRPRARHVALCG